MSQRFFSQIFFYYKNLYSNNILIFDFDFQNEFFYVKIVLQLLQNG